MLDPTMKVIPAGYITITDIGEEDGMLDSTMKVIPAGYITITDIGEEAGMLDPTMKVIPEGYITITDIGEEAGLLDPEILNTIVLTSGVIQDLIPFSQFVFEKQKKKKYYNSKHSIKGHTLYAVLKMLFKKRADVFNSSQIIPSILTVF